MFNKFEKSDHSLSEFDKATPEQLKELARIDKETIFKLLEGLPVEEWSKVIDYIKQRTDALNQEKKNDE